MAFEGEDARRWQMVDAPVLMPGVDFITKSPNGPFIDTGISVSVENRGRVYLSVETIREMAEIAGVIETKDNAAQALHDKEQYEKGYADGLKKEGQLVESLMAITHILASRSAGIDDLSGDEVAKKLAKTAGIELRKSGGNSDDVQDAPVGSRKPRGKTVAADSSSGPDDVPSLSDDNDPFKL